MIRKLLVLVALIATVALAGACGPSEDGGPSAKKEPAKKEPEKAEPEKAEKPTAVETVRVAYRETAAEQTARTAFEMTTTGPRVDPEGSGRPAPMTTTMTGRGAMNFSGSEATLTMDMFGMGAMEVRQVGDVVYVKMPEEFMAQMPGAKPWIEMDANSVYGQPAGAAGDPTRQLEYLRGVSDSVEKVGRGEVRGVQTTRYRATIDMKEAVAERGGEARKASDETLRQLGVSKVPVEIWLDDQNRVRRYAMDMTMSMPENTASPEMPEGGKMRMNMVVEYYDFGLPLNVQAPPPNQTTDGSKLMAQQQTLTQ